MEFVSIRIITEDVQRLAGFYEQVTGLPVTVANENFAELRTAAGTLAIGSARTVPRVRARGGPGRRTTTR